MLNILYFSYKAFLLLVKDIDKKTEKQKVSSLTINVEMLYQ